MPQTILSRAPQVLREHDDIALIGGSLFLPVTWEKTHDANVLDFLYYAREQRGIERVEFVPTDIFDRKYRGVNSGTGKASEIEDQAMEFLTGAYEKKASDIHFADYGTNGVVRLRCLGMLRDYTEIPGSRIGQIINVLFGTMADSANSTMFFKNKRQDARIIKRNYLPEGVHSVRVHTEPLDCAQAEGGVGTFMALRLLHDRTEATGGLEERLAILGYDKTDIKKIASLVERTGLTIIAGPTGHGKSTLLKHMMDGQALQNPEKNYMSIEDPPEYPLEGVHQIKVATNDDKDDPAKRATEYTNAIAGAMRSDPDVLMIGEIRYYEAAMAALEAALTGHGTFTTLHANRAIGIIPRMQFLLTSPGKNGASETDPLQYLCDHNVLAGLIYQRLVPVLCPHCKQPLRDYAYDSITTEKKKFLDMRLPPVTRERMYNVVPRDQWDSVYFRGEGCVKCNDLGIVSQTVAAEIIVTDETFLRHIRNKNHDRAVEYWLQEMRGRTYIQHAIEGIAGGRLDPYQTELRLGVPLNFVPMKEEKVAA